MIRSTLRRLLGRGRSRSTVPATAPAAPVERPPPPARPQSSEPASTEQIEALVTSAPVVLFMKGNRHQPQCGFSATTIATLDQLLDDYVTIDVLADMEVREGVKAYSDWPTIPQLYIDGQFVGGCDIVQQLHSEGELAQLLCVEPKAPAAEVPAVHETSPATIAQWLAHGGLPVFLDVRTPEEVELASIDGAVLLTRDRLPELELLPRDTRIVFHCHHGLRSRQAAEAFRTLGFTDLHNLAGGIDAWSTQIDDRVPRY